MFKAESLLFSVGLFVCFFCLFVGVASAQNAKGNLLYKK